MRPSKPIGWGWCGKIGSTIHGRLSIGPDDLCQRPQSLSERIGLRPLIDPEIVHEFPEIAVDTGRVNELLNGVTALEIVVGAP